MSRPFTHARLSFPAATRHIRIGLALLGWGLLGGGVRSLGQTLVNAGFETSGSVNLDDATYTETFGSLDQSTGITGWVFGTSSVASHSLDGIVQGTGFGRDGTVPAGGSQAAFIQGTGSIAQTITDFPAGTFTISFYAKRRSDTGGIYGPNPLTVTIDATTLTFGGSSTVAPNSLTEFVTFTSDSIALGAGAHTLTFTGTIPYGVSDKSTLLDNVSISAIPEPSTYAAVAAGGVLLGAIWFRWRKGHELGPREHRGPTRGHGDGFPSL